jgi:hypothetical protein
VGTHQGQPAHARPADAHEVQAALGHGRRGHRLHLTFAGGATAPARTGFGIIFPVISRSLLRALLPALLLVAAVPATAAAETYTTPPDEEVGLLAPLTVANPNPPPSVTGSPQVGGTLTGSRGTWPDADTITSRWLRCNPATNDCQPTGDTDLTYSVSPADQGAVMMLRVAGTRNGLPGNSRTRFADAVSSPIAPAPVGPTAPRNVVAPTLTGDAREGKTVGVRLGQWTGTDPITYAYAWASCPPGGTCRAVSSASSYRVKASDVGNRLLMRVTATNAAGATAAFAQTGFVAGKATLKRLSPFPTLLIDGRVAGATTSISTLRLRRVPGGSTIGQSCTGRGCPFRKASTKVRKGKTRTVALRRLQRRMRAGTTVVITVRKGQTLGKYIRLRFRRNLAPARVDRCVAPKSSKPVKCP